MRLGAMAQSELELDAATVALADGDRTGPTWADEPTGPRRRTYGRYEVIATLGAGGMGVVLAAHDPKLDRTVAIKILKFGGGGNDAASASRRILREARAMASVSHPNVVPVYDVGTAGTDVFVAMECVRGRSLRLWLRDGQSPADILRVFTEAGAGLAAAHARGLIHRDFKPDNVLIDDQGRARVMDFGLARGIPTVDLDDDDETLPSGSGVSLSLGPDLTATGFVMGTPAYMSPEQFMRRELDARADQFSFCVALYEALAGRRPFAGDTSEAIAKAIRAGRIPALPRRRGVPRRVDAIVRRGLAAEPHHRWPDMNALLRALNPARGRRIALAGFGLTIAAVTGAAIGLQPSDRCDDASMAAVWNDARRSEIAAGFEASSAPYAQAARVRVEAAIDDYAHRWNALHRSWCEAKDARPLARACLERRRLQVDALLTVLSAGTAAAVEHAADAVSSLPPVDDCATVSADVAGPTPPAADIAAAVQQLRAQVARAEALATAGRFDEGRTLAEQIVSDAAGLSYEPVRAEALLVLGRLQERTGDPTVALETLQEAAFAAQGSGDPTLAARAMIRVVGVLGSDLARYDEGLEWAAHAEAALVRIGDPPRLRADLQNNLGHLQLGRGDTTVAHRLHAEALELRQQLHGDDHDSVAVSRINLGNVAYRLGDYEAAQGYYEAALDIRTATHGPDHPGVALIWHNLGLVLRDRGELAQARSHLDRALALRTAALGPVHPRVAATRIALGELATTEGRVDEAFAHHTAALAIHREVLGPRNPATADLANKIANVSYAAGRFAEARDHYLEALAAWNHAHGDNAASIAIAKHNLGLVHHRLGDHDRARAFYTEAIELRARTIGTSHPKYGKSWVGLGRVLADEGDHDAAEDALRRGLAVYDQLGADEQRIGPAARGAARFWHAQAQVQLGHDPHTVAAAVRRAREELVAGDDAETMAELDRWWKARGPD